MSVSSPGSVARAYQRSQSRTASTSFELWSWYFFRVSGVLILFLVFGHILVVHILNNVDDITYQFVANRWQSLGWRFYDWLLLALTLTHGQNGLRVMIDDYVHQPAWRLIAHTLNWSVLGVFLALGTLTIVTFPTMPGLQR
jgi:succinate dehydrogenase / fumarate reductase membrane anchor subunit